ncbi:hypothetical protein RchiOBHm_Chr3g0479621 [Rosa chinensis]|uniref:Uncharacterized protein n=1 Tax=Rosa chinensis TaxID=74649 RepID=A0A2P6RDH4_ROSCH|nr:hypothetical protein RchiOBHm_Chr3g0479621 [Rosa chinensis]
MVNLFDMSDGVSRNKLLTNKSHLDGCCYSTVLKDSHNCVELTCVL